MQTLESVLTDELKMKVTQMIAEGYSYSEIIQFINDELSLEGEDVFHEYDLKNMFDREAKEVVKEMRENPDFMSTVKDQYVNTVTVVNELAAEMRDLLYRIKDEMTTKEGAKEMVKTAATLLKICEHIDRVVGRLNTAQMNITINKVDLSKKIANIMPNMLEKLEKKGAIKVKSKKLVSEILK